MLLHQGIGKIDKNESKHTNVTRMEGALPNGKP
jgi:hypothetical protein